MTFPHSQFPDVDLCARAAAAVRARAGDADGTGGWTTAAALAVADWLDVGANPYACVQHAPMVVVARAFLGEAGQ